MKLSLKLYATVLTAAITIGGLTAAQAQVETETQFAMGRSYVMPAGDFAMRSGTPVRESSRGRPDEEGRLKELKGLGHRPGNSGAGAPQIAATQRASIQSLVTGANGACQTNTATDYAPSDIHGAVGHDNFVTVTNVDIGVYSKFDCSLISREGLTTLFDPLWSNGVPSSQTIFDARVIFDPSADPTHGGRFLVTADSSDGYTNDQYQYFAVSQDGSGTSWYLYVFTLSQGTTVRFCKNRISDFWITRAPVRAALAGTLPRTTSAPSTPRARSYRSTRRHRFPGARSSACASMGCSPILRRPS